MSNLWKMFTVTNAAENVGPVPAPPADRPDDRKWCPACDGKGTTVKTYDDYGMADPKNVRCWTCEGSGYVRPA